MAIPLTPLKFYIAYLNSPVKKPYYLCDIFLDLLHRTGISKILAYFCLNLVAMAPPLARLKF